MPGILQGAWGIAPGRSIWGALFNEGSRYVGGQCQQHRVSATTEVHKGKRGEVLGSLLTGSATWLVNFTQIAKAGAYLG